jgi:hypothetical protein
MKDSYNDDITVMDTTARSNESLGGQNALGACTLRYGVLGACYKQSKSKQVYNEKYGTLSSGFRC